MILLANTFVWLSLRNLAFLRLGKRWPELGSSTWVVAVPSLLSRFPFSQTFSGFKNTFGLEKKSHSTKSLKRESSGKLYTEQTFWGWQQHMGCRCVVVIVPLPFFTNFFWVQKYFSKKSHSTQSLKRESSGNCTLDKLFEVGSSTWVVAVTYLLSCFPFYKLFLGSKILLDLRKNPILPKILERESIHL